MLCFISILLYFLAIFGFFVFPFSFYLLYFFVLLLASFCTLIVVSRLFELDAIVFVFIIIDERPYQFKDMMDDLIGFDVWRGQKCCICRS